MVDERYAHITCRCGERMQVMHPDGLEWDEEASTLQYREHLAVCPKEKVHWVRGVIDSVLYGNRNI